MPLDPQVKVLVDMMKDMSFSGLSPDEARKQTNAMRASRTVNPEVVAKVEDRKIPGPARSIAVASIRPRAKAPSRCWSTITAVDL